MNFQALDILLILLGGFFFQSLRAIWYSDAFFGDSWKRYSTVGELSEKVRNRNYVTAYLLSLFTSTVILVAVKSSIMSNGVSVIITPLIIITLFLFFTIPIVLTEYLFDSRNMKLFYIYYGYVIVAITALSYIYSYLLGIK